MEERAFLMCCWLDVLLVECIRIVSLLFNTSIHHEIRCDFLRDEMLPLTED